MSPLLARPRSRSEIERPVFDQEAIISKIFGFVKSGHPLFRFLLLQKRDAQMEVESANASTVGVVSKKKEGHHLFRCSFVLILGRNRHSGRVRFHNALVYRD